MSIILLNHTHDNNSRDNTHNNRFIYPLTISHIHRRYRLQSTENIENTEETWGYNQEWKQLDLTEARMNNNDDDNTKLMLRSS